MYLSVSHPGPVKYLRQGLGGLVAFCVAIRVGAWLIAPVWPLIIILLALAGIFRLLTGRPYGGS